MRIQLECASVGSRPVGSGRGCHASKLTIFRLNIHVFLQLHVYSRIVQVEITIGISIKSKSRYVTLLGVVEELKNCVFLKDLQRIREISMICINNRQEEARRRANVLN